MAKARNKVGRPGEYRTELCDEVIPLLKQGMGIEELGYALDIGYSTIYQWMDKYPEFKEAINKGREYSHGWWMKQGRENIENKEFNSTLWYMNMKNRFQWRDKPKDETSHDEATSLMQKLIDKL